MAYDEQLAERVRRGFRKTRVRFEERRMMSGLCFLVDGKMCAGVEKHRLMARIEPEVYDAALLRKGKWVPVDISEADKNSSLATYYFGHHPANRFEFGKGRDLVVEPQPASGPINFLAYPVMEVDGKTVKIQTEFLFSCIAPASL